MKPILIIASILVVILTAASIFLWAGVFGTNNIPADWATYRHQQIGFSVSHPPGMDVYYEEVDGAGFSLGTNTEDHGLYFGVARIPLYDQTLEQIAQEQTWTGDVEPITLAGKQGYRFLGDEDGSTEWWGIVLPFGEQEYLELSYSFDSTNQEHAQTAQHMLDSFEVTQPGSISPLAIVFGVLLALGILIGAGLLFISRPR